MFSVFNYDASFSGLHIIFLQCDRSMLPVLSLSSLSVNIGSSSITCELKSAPLVAFDSNYTNKGNKILNLKKT